MLANGPLMERCRMDNQTGVAERGRRKIESVFLPAARMRDGVEYMGNQVGMHTTRGKEVGKVEQ
jgi:hypothetical protein